MAFTFAAAMTLRLRSRGLRRRALLMLRLWRRPLAASLRRRALCLRLRARRLLGALLWSRRLPHHLLLPRGLLRLRVRPHLLRPLGLGLLALLHGRLPLLHCSLPLLHHGLSLRRGLLSRRRALLLLLLLPRGHRLLTLRQSLLARSLSLRLLLLAQSDPFALRVLRGHALRHPVRGLRRHHGLRLSGALPLELSQLASSAVVSARGLCGERLHALVHLLIPRVHLPRRLRRGLLRPCGVTLRGDCGLPLVPELELLTATVAGHGFDVHRLREIRPERNYVRD
jgi:hypothetical protein